MTFACPGCGHKIKFGDAACAGCKLPLTVGAVMGAYLQKFRTRCPHCKFPVSISSPVCPSCKQAITVEAALKTTAKPATDKWEKFNRSASSKTKRRFQWVYFFGSLILLGGLVNYLADSDSTQLLGRGLMSALYMGVTALMLKWFVPARVYRTVLQRASKLVKISLVFNICSLILILQIVIGHWWAQAAVLAALFASCWLAGYFLFNFIFPMSQGFRDFFTTGDQPDPRFNPEERQGRNARYD